jgi:anti-sigma factor RsiW
MGCQLEDVAAYVDGELTGAALEDFEAHLRSCGACADELRTQKQLLCTLDVAFNDSRSFELPREFSRVVTARAESDLSGVRRKRERRRALKLCAALALTSFALMGAAARGLVIDPLRSVFRVANILLDFAGRAALDLAETVTVFVRVFTRAIFSAPHGIGVMFLVALLFSILLLPFLIARYHRAQIVE